MPTTKTTTTRNAILLALILLFISTPSIIIISAADSLCTIPPPGCFLDCPSGYEKIGADTCLCLCKQPAFGATCFGFICKADERCVNVNGRVGCIPVTPVNPLLLPSAPSSPQIARPILPAVVVNSGVHLGPRDQYQSVGGPSSSAGKESKTTTGGSESGGNVLVGECPSMVSGNCEVQCRSDSDCPQIDAGMRCCPNGCGRECVLAAVNVVPFQSHLAIRPLKTGGDGGGANANLNKNDGETGGGNKNKNNNNDASLLEQCKIKCTNSLYECQLVESDCAQPPCPSVPKCLINPCPTGTPMKMPSGVTALCRRQQQCWDGFWCHQCQITTSHSTAIFAIGYNGLGFCCPEPKKVVKAGACPAQKLTNERRNEELAADENGQKSTKKCSAECKSDGDCALVEKCCFDGCGLKCRRIIRNGNEEEGENEQNGGENAGGSEFGGQQSTLGPKIGTEGGEGGNLALLRPSGHRPTTSPGKCPTLSEQQRSQLDCAAPGTDECARDRDCSGHLKCCSDGCQMRCIYIPPQSHQQQQQHQLGISEEETGSYKSSTSPTEERRPAEENLIKMGGGRGEQEEEGEFGQNAEENGKKIGKCPKQQFCMGKQRGGRREEEEDECQNDGDCAGLQKCCLDGCGIRACQFPALSTECLSQRMAAQIFAKFSKHNRNRGFKPKCDQAGRFLPIQRSSDGFSWCVDSRGMELPGTRLPNDHFDGCERPRICPFIQCPLKCPFGHQMDGIGCPQCICKDSPCRGIQCPESNVCRMVQRKCFGGGDDQQSGGGTQNCLIPECVLNICLQGDPLEDAESGAMLRCDEARSRKCPAGYYCHKMGIGDGGYCCSGLVLQSELLPSASKCPAMPNLAYKHKNKKAKNGENAEGQIVIGSTKNALGCRFSRECGEGRGEYCCFNGWASECTKIGENAEEGERRENAGGENSAAGNSGRETVDRREEEEQRADEKREEGKNQRGKLLATTMKNTPSADVVEDGDNSPRGNFGTTTFAEKIDASDKFPSGSCPTHLQNASNPGCAGNCREDGDCAKRSAQMRCCRVGCGQQCHFPERLSPCVHLLATTLREVDKLAKMPESMGRPTVQCTEEGQFQPVQFDALTGQYWCVNVHSGIEQPGTRISSSPIGSALPDCAIRHQCKFECPAEKCEHGLRLDHKGCPDERCECRNACQDFKCSLASSEICVLKPVKCSANSGPCPSVPICVPNVCRLQSSTPQMELANNRVCLKATDCSNGNECRPLNEPIERVGLCCKPAEERQFEQPLVDSPSTSFNEPAINNIANGGIIPNHHHHQHTVETRQGICPAPTISSSGTNAGNGGRPSEMLILNGGGPPDGCVDECKRDSQCAGIQKCCPTAMMMADSMGKCWRCVQPLLATNCQNLLYTLQSMDSARIHHFIAPPNCDGRRGTFARVQCDGQSYCWCVDPQMGRPILGTRKLQPVGDFCSERKTCPIFCPQRRLLECPFGVDLDLDGCPLTSECRCRTPCEQVRCPEGEICLLGQRDCRERERDEEAQCLPMPLCQRSPCGGRLQPALGSNSKIPLRCFLPRQADTAADSADQLCPSGFRCVRPIHHLHGEQKQQQGGDGAQGVCCPLSEEETGEMRQLNAGENVEQGTNPCILPMDQGLAQGCTRSMELRFFHDFSQHSCEEFVFSGCAGNSNNFRSREECEQRCLAGDAGQREDEQEMFSMGFTLVPPPGSKIGGARMDNDNDDGREAAELESSLRSYLHESFGLASTQIRDVHFGGSDSGGSPTNHVQFSIVAKDARRKAKSISDTLASGQFQFPHQNQLYRAEPNTWSARQIPLASSSTAVTGNAEKNAKSALFWVILTASIFFSLIVLMVLCCGFAFLRDHRTTSSGGSVCFSPSPQVGAIHHHWSPLPGRKNAETLSAEEIHRMRTNAAAGGTGHLLTPMASSSTTASSTHLPVQSGATSSSKIIAPRIIPTEEAASRMAERRGGGGTAKNQQISTTTTTMYY